MTFTSKTSPIINVSENKTDYPIEVLKDRLEGKKVGPTGPVEVGIDRKTIIDTKSTNAESIMAEYRKDKNFFNFNEK